MLLERLIAARDRSRATKQNDAGLALLDVLIMIIILGLILMIGVSAMNNFRRKAYEAQETSDAKMKEVADAANGVSPSVTPTPTPDPTPITTAPPTPDDPIAWATVFGFIGVAVIVLLALFSVGVFTVRYRTNQRTALTARATLVSKWEHAVAKHMTIKDAYGTLLGDPVAALSHSALWDIQNSRTQAFHEVYARVQDIYSLNSTGCPADPELVDEYANEVRKSETVWDDAVAHAERLGYDWMPHTDKTAARRATAMLKKVTNPASSEAEKGLAAAKAKELIDSIGAVRFKTETLTAIATTARLALPGSPVGLVSMDKAPVAV